MARSVGLTRIRVVTVAAELADASGLDGLVLAHVAARLGVRLPSLYNHVDGLPGLHRELALLGVAELQERMMRAAIGKASDEAVMALALAYQRFVNERPGLYAATVRAPDPNDQELLAASQQLLDLIVAILAPYGLDERAAIHAVRGLRSLVHGFATLEQAGGFGMPVDRAESFRWLVSAYINGLRTASTAEVDVGHATSVTDFVDKAVTLVA